MQITWTLFPLYKKMLYIEPRGYVAYYSKFPSFYASPQPLIPAEPYIMHREREKERETEWGQWRIYYRMYRNGAVEICRNMNLGTSEKVVFNSGILALICYVEYGGRGDFNLGYHAASMDKRIARYRRIVVSSKRRKTSTQWCTVIYLKGAFLKHAAEAVWILALAKGQKWACSIM